MVLSKAYMQFIGSYHFSSPVKRNEKMYIQKWNNISKILKKRIPRNKDFLKAKSN